MSRGSSTLRTVETNCLSALAFPREELGEGCLVAQIATQNQVTGSSNAGSSSSSICSTLLSAPLVLHSQPSRPTVGLQVLLRQFHTTNSAQLILRPPGLMLLTPFPGWLAWPMQLELQTQCEANLACCRLHSASKPPSSTGTADSMHSTGQEPEALD